VTDFSDDTRRNAGEVARRLSAALRPEPGDLDHPAHEQLVAFVDARLDTADQDWIAGHLIACARCTEDVADLREVQQQLDVNEVPAATPLPRSTRWTAYASIAAGLTLMAWAGGLLPTFESGRETTAVHATLLTDAERQMVENSLESGQLPWPAFHDAIRAQQGTLLSDTPTAAPLRPTAPIATSTTTPRPRFEWSAGADTTSYVVSVFDEQFTEVTRSGALTTTQWTPDTDLPRGQVLAWQITATGPSGTITSPAPPHPEARFVVLAPTEAANVAALRARLTDDPLALGVQLASLGLYADAEAALARAVRDPRYDSSQVQQLLTALRNR